MTNVNDYLLMDVKMQKEKSKLYSLELLNLTEELITKVLTSSRIIRKKMA